MIDRQRLAELRKQRNDSVRELREKFGMEPDHEWDDVLDTLSALLTVKEALEKIEAETSQVWAESSDGSMPADSANEAYKEMNKIAREALAAVKEGA